MRDWAAEYPLREPPRWRGAQPVGAFTLWFGVVTALLGAVLTVMVAAGGAPFVGIVAVSWLIAAGIVVAGLWVLDRMPRARAELVNAVAVTPGDRPPDDWVHLVRGRALPPLLHLGLAAYGAYGVAMAVGAFVDAEVRGDGAAVVMGVVFACIGVGMLALAVWAALARRRLSSFGHPPIGLTLGPSGVTIVTIGGTRFVAWHDIRGVGTVARARSRDTEHLYRTVRLQVHTAAGELSEVQLPASRYRLEPAALYTALATFSEHPEARRELGTTRAQALLDLWCDAAARRGTTGG